MLLRLTEIAPPSCNAHFDLLVDLFRLVDELGRRKILLNFGNVEFLSSAALGKLITMNRKVQAVRGKLVLCNISREIREVFEITKLDKLFTILPDEQAALQAF